MYEEYGSFEKSAPINEGEIHKDLKIENKGREGDGIAKINGFVVFVPDTSVGDTVDVRITKVARKVAFAEVV